MQSVLNGMDRVSQFLGLAVSHFYLVCAVVTAFEVAMRYLFNSPTLWAFEVVMVICASAWVLSGAYVTMRRGHIAITVLYQYTKGWARWWLDLIIQLVALASMCVLVYALWDPMRGALRGGIERSGSSFNSPEPTVLKTLLFVGALLYALQTLANLIRHLHRSGHPAKPELEAE